MKNNLKILNQIIFLLSVISLILFVTNILTPLVTNFNRKFVFIFLLFTFGSLFTYFFFTPEIRNGLVKFLKKTIKFVSLFDPFNRVIILISLLTIFLFAINIFYPFVSNFIKLYKILTIFTIFGTIFLSLIFNVKFLNKTIHVLVKMLKLLERWTNKLVKHDITLLGCVFVKHHRYMKFIFTNNLLLDNHEILKPIYNYLMSDETFINFGYYKVIIITMVNEDENFQLHHNVLITNDTPFEKYYEKVEKHIKYSYDEGSTAGVSVFKLFEVLVWNMDDLKNKHIKITSDARHVFEKKNIIQNVNKKRHYHNYIKPLKHNKVEIKNFATLDVETINYKGWQQPISICLTWSKETKLFIIDLNLFNVHLEKAVNNLWKELFVYLEVESKFNFEIIFIHNLGKFDGVFLFKALSNYYDPSRIKTVIDEKNNFILISLKFFKYNITFKDSLRIFPISLQSLCEVFNVEGKLFKYKKAFNNIEMFNNEDILNQFIQYSEQDSKALYKALLTAQNEFLKHHNVDITTIVSMSSLAMKIFRSNYLKTDIPILTTSEDDFVRKSYFGGATDYYKAYAKNLYYYDINSLYPKAMCNLMPHKVIKKYDVMDNLDLNKFFGFCHVEVNCDNNVSKPVLPVKFKGKNIFPRGRWEGVYFSEELKLIKSLGYTIKLIRGLEFNKIDLFSEYVNHFYSLKMKSTGSERWISKLLLNCLYGTFGRKKELLDTINIYNQDLEKYLLTNIIKKIININDKISTLLIIKNINSDILENLNSSYSLEIKPFQSTVKSNVAIASAITAYARMYMLNFKLDNSVVYTDTDSIFTEKKLESNLLGKEIGLMKDELKGLTIKEAYFLDIKQYGYWFNNSEGERIEKSVFSGVKRNSLSFKEVEYIFKGGISIKEIPVRFYRYLDSLKIKIKKSKISIKKTSDKILYNNIYLPPIINTKNNNMLTTILNKLIKYRNNLLQKYKIMKIKKF
jgi:hypothetical protein